MEGPSDLCPGDPSEAPRTIHALPAYQHADLPDTTTFSELPAVSFADNDGEDWPTSPDVSELQAFSSENVTDAEEDFPDTTTFSELQAVSFADNDGEELAKANKVSRLQAVPYAEGVTDEREKWPTSPDVSELQAFSSENVTDAEEVATFAEMPVLQLSSSDPFENLISSEETSLGNAESEKRVENEVFVAEPECISEATAYVWLENEKRFIEIGSEDTDTVEEQEEFSTEHGVSPVKLTPRYCTCQREQSNSNRMTVRFGSCEDVQITPRHPPISDFPPGIPITKEYVQSFLAAVNRNTLFPYRCVACWRAFASADMLFSHVTHGVLGDFSCLVFFQRWKLMRRRLRMVSNRLDAAIERRAHLKRKREGIHSLPPVKLCCCGRRTQENLNDNSSSSSSSSSSSGSQKRKQQDNILRCPPPKRQLLDTESF